ncbi:MAG TPA: HU family DNA-binding protein [Blastocatellia bacterium]|nr:HU family DNA-binding protein [Blastocatellia bacterium]
MNRTTLRRLIARRTGRSLKDSARALEAMLDVIERTLARRESISIPGVGRLVARTARNGRMSVALRPARASRRAIHSTQPDLVLQSPLLGGDMDQKDNQDEHGERRGSESTPLGLDIGTSRIVLSRGVGPGSKTETQLNAFVAVPYSKFTENILKQNRVTYHLNGGREIFIFGNESEKFANFFNTDSRRPMRNGVLNPREENGLLVIQSIIEKVLPKTRKNELVCFSVPGPGREIASDLVYHEAMLKNLISSLGYRAKAVNEGLAVVFAELESENFTGIGISCGGGMCNICLAYMSVPVFALSTSKAGDYIDTSVASVTGEAPTRVRTIKEEGLDLRRQPHNKFEAALSIYYDEMILSLVEALRTDFAQHANLPRMDRPIPIVVSGGTATPRGFVEKFTQQLDQAELPFKVSDVRLASDPLTATARGCAIAAMHEE